MADCQSKGCQHKVGCLLRVDTLFKAHNSNLEGVHSLLLIYQRPSRGSRKLRMPISSRLPISLVSTYRLLEYLLQ